MQRFPDKEAQAPGAGQCHISVCFTPGRHLMSRMSQFRIRDKGSRGAQVQIQFSKIELMRRIPSVRFNQLKEISSSDTE